jgi:hypothetical protein
MEGDVEKVAGLTVKEPDRGAIAHARWNAFPSSPVEARTRGDIKPCRRKRLSVVGAGGCLSLPHLTTGRRHRPRSLALTRAHGKWHT